MLIVVRNCEKKKDVIVRWNFNHFGETLITLRSIYEIRIKTKEFLSSLCFSIFPKWLRLNHNYQKLKD